MNDEQAGELLRHGSAEDWNNWRQSHRAELTFSRPHWYDCPGPGGVQVKGRNRVDFSGRNLSGLMILNAFAEGLQARDATIENTIFEEGDFSRADFSGTTFRDTRFNKTILTGASFQQATFINCNLNRVNLVEADFRVREITETVVYGISAWDLQTSDEMRQSKLVIEKTYEFYSDLIDNGVVPMMVDDIELAQFVYYLSNHKKMRDTLNVLNEKGVLLLGSFRGGGLERLYGLREWFHARGYMAMIFDFARPDNLSLTETVVTMAGLSKFIVVDLTGPSVPAELQAILTQIKKPIVAYGDPYALFPDLADQTAVVVVEEEADLFNSLGKTLPEIEALHAERMIALAQRYTAADSRRLRSSP